MRCAAGVLVSLAVASLVSCGGGSDRSEPVTELLAFSLVSTGVVPTPSPAASSQVIIISSAEQLTALATRLFTIPAALATFDFAQGDIIYVEGAGDRDPTSVARVSRVSRTANVESVTAEICISVARVPGPHRPYALYTTQNIAHLGGITVATAFFECPTVQRLPSTVVAAGIGTPFVSPPPTQFIRDAAAYAQVAQYIGVTAPPPDFSLSMLVLITAVTSDPQMRFMGAYQNGDGSRDFVIERCGNLAHPNMQPYFLLVMIPASSVDPRLVSAVATPPDCVTPAP